MKLPATKARKSARINAPLVVKPVSLQGMQQRILGILAALFFSLSFLSIETGCANIIPPQGGPRDSIAPVLLKVVPGDSNLGFNAKKIEFYFDEYIEVQDPFTNVLVSPLPSNSPVVESRLRDLTVRLKDSLLPNTTYVIDFGNAIKDFTEGNIAKNLRYVFSTGNYIDSLEIKGQVLLAESGKADSTLIAILHIQGEDSAVAKTKPLYLSKLDKEGRFHFKNLPAKKFYLYALKDEGGSRRYTAESQLFAFADSIINTTNPPDSLKLFAFVAKPQENASFAPETPKAKEKPDTDRRLKYQTGLQNNQQDLLENFKFIFESPLKRFDTTGIKLYTDSTFSPVDSILFEKDSTQKSWQLITRWKEGQSYHLVLQKGAAEDSLGKQWQKTDTLDFTTKRTTDYGRLKIRLRGLDMTLSPVLFFMQGDRIFKSIVLSDPIIEDNLFPPGEYPIRILYDENKNGKWDTGQFFGKRKQPEKVQPLEKKITVKSNWSNEYEIDIR
jgi:hypothetical protein